MATVLNSYINASAAPASVTLVGSSYVSNAATSGIPYPAGTTAGDIAMYINVSTSGGGTLISGWSGGSAGIGSGGMQTNMSHGRKVLVSGDLVGGSLTGFTQNGPGLLVVYRNGSAVAVKTTTMVPTDPDTGFPLSDVTFSTSFTKGTGSKKLINLFLSTVSLTTITAPFTAQLSTSSYVHSDADSSSYTSGDTLTTSWSNSDYRMAQATFEIT